MTENEQKIINKISDLSGDYKCYDNRINHEESLVLDRLLTEIQQYRAIGTVEQLEWCKDASHWKELFKEKLEQYESIGTIDEFKALKEKNEQIPIIHGKAELELHDKGIRNKAIEEFAERIKREFRISVKYKDEELRWIDEIADQLKKEGAV